MRGKKRERRGKGEYTYPEDHFFRSFYNPERINFYNYVFQYVPEISNYFKDILIPEYKNSIIIAKKNNIKDLSWRSIKENKLLIEMKKCLIKFRDKYNFNDDWLIELVVDDLFNRVNDIPREVNNIFEMQRLDPKGYFSLLKEANKTKVDLGSYYWDPINQTKAEFKEMVRNDIDEKLETQLNDICSYLEENGFKKVPTKENMNKRLILYHVMGLSQKEVLDVLSEEDGVIIGKSALSETVREQAEMIGLTLRS